VVSLSYGNPVGDHGIRKTWVLNKRNRTRPDGWNPNLGKRTAFLLLMQVAQSNSIPFIIFRSVSDLAGGGDQENEVNSSIVSWFTVRNAADVLLVVVGPSLRPDIEKCVE
jgi:hypothetical protein